MALLITFLILAGTALGAIAYGGHHARRQKSSEQGVTEWAVGGRSFGTILFWFMNAGEIYTTFAVFGIAGYAWAMGAPAYLAFCSVSLSYAVGYWLMPKIWQCGRDWGLITQADFFARRFDSVPLGVFTGLVGIASLVIYVQIQLISLGLVVQLTLGTSIGETASTVLAGVLMVSFVLFSGLRSAAFAAAVKDVLMVVLVVILAVTVANKVGAASMLDVFHMAETRFPGIGSLPGLKPEAGTSTVWLMTAALNIALGNWVFPHLFQISYAAGSPVAIRRNAIWQPIYSLSFFFIVLIGFAALLAGTEPPNGNANAALLQFVSDKYDPWVVGLLAGTGFLLALAPGSVLLLTASSILTRNLVAPLRPGLSEKASLRISQVGLVGIAALAVWISLTQKGSLVNILLGAYSAVGMLAPAVFLGFLWKRVSATAVFLGIVAGFITLLTPEIKAQMRALLPGVEPGLIAMAVNTAVLVFVTWLAPRRSSLHPSAVSAT